MSSLTSALSTAFSGLQANQASLALVSANVANADTPGYTRKTLDQVATSAGGTTGVRTTDVQRELDQYIQQQLRSENAGASYADTRAQMYQQLQGIYGQPGAADALDTVYNNFTSSLQALSTSPDDSSAQSAVVSNAQLLAQQLNQMTASVQSLRQSAELGISNAVSQANNAMSVKTNHTPIKVRGSAGFTPYSKLASKRPTTRAIRAPAATPTKVSSSPCLTIICSTSAGPAPSAMRRPISWVRWATE